MDLPASFARKEPCLVADLVEAEHRLRFRLPEDLREFLLDNGGGEGFIGAGYLRLPSPSGLVEMDQGYDVPTFFEGLVLIGSDGADEAFAIDRTTGRYVMTPFIGDGPDTRIDAGGTIGEFLTFIEGGAPIR